jgi:hypothetical protein
MPRVTRRRFLAVAGLTAFGGCGYGLYRGVQNVRKAAMQSADF